MDSVDDTDGEDVVVVGVGFGIKNMDANDSIWCDMIHMSPVIEDECTVISDTNFLDV